MMKLRIKFLNFRYLPFMLLVAIVGILISLLDFAFTLAVLILFVLAIVGFVIFKKTRKYTLRIAVLLVTFVIFALAGGSVISKATAYHPVINNALVAGTINSDSDMVGEPIDGTNSLRYRLILANCTYTTKSENGKLDGFVGAYLPLEKDTNFKVGDTIIIHADIIPKTIKIAESVNIYNYMDGVRYNLDYPTLSEIISDKASLIESIRVRARDSMINNIPAGGMMYSVVFGDKKVLSDTFVSSVNLTGLAHLFAVSGLHLGLVASIIGWITKRLKAHKLVDYFVVLSLSFLYALLVGFTPSITRAFLMLTIYKSGNLFGVRHCGISSLSLSAIIILLINPLTLFNLSFQLTTMAIVGILFFYKPINKVIKTKWKAFNSFVAMNLSVNIATLPILLHCFGSVSLIFLFANILVVPLVTLLFPFIFVGTLLSCIYSYLAYIIYPLGFVFSFVELLVNLVAKIPFLSVNIKLNILLMTLYIVFLVIISTYSLISKKPKIILSVLLSVTILISSLLTSFGILDGSAKIETIAANTHYDMIMVDVKNEHYLICNGNLSLYSIYKCKSFMSEKNITKLDGIVKASFDNDELFVLSKYKDTLNIKKLITSTKTEPLTDIFGKQIYFAVTSGGCIIAPLDEYIVEISTGDCKIVFVDNRSGRNPKFSGHINILYCIGNNDFVRDIMPDYFVNDKAVLNYIPQSVNSYFTFIIKDDKIKIR